MTKSHIIIYGHEFPNPVEPFRGTFIARMIEHYPEDFDIKVVAPVPCLLAWRRGKLSIKIPSKDVLFFGKHKVEVFYPRYILFPRNILMMFIGRFESISTFSLISKLKHEWKIDLLHVHFSYPDGVAARLICRKLNLPYVVTEHLGAIGQCLDNPNLKKQILRVYKDAARVIAVSEYTKQQIISRSSDPLSITVIPNGVKLDRFIPRSKHLNPYNLVFVGNLIKNKGVQILLDAIALLQKKKVEICLTVIGDGKYRTKLEEKVRLLHLEDFVTFWGYQSPGEISSLLPSFDILVLPSFLESFSVVLIEAMAAGLPVIATRCGGPESIVTTETGILVDSGSAEQLEEAIILMKEHWNTYDPDVIRQYAGDKFDIDKVINKQMIIYKDVLGNRHAER